MPASSQAPRPPRRQDASTTTTAPGEWDTIFTPDNTRYQGELVLVLDRNQGRDQDGELAGSAAEGLATHGLLWS
jgi:hypothetical protein